MYDPSMRVLTVLELLQAKARVTGRELADRLEVSDRTIQRYITRLQDLGVPVESTRGPGGAYRLKPGFRMPPLMLGTDEAFAVSLGLDALSYVGLADVAPAAESVKAKLERVMPLAVGERAESFRAALVLDRPRSIVEADLSLLTELAAATHGHNRVRMRYRRRDGKATIRTVEPYGLMQHDGRWFMAAYCMLRKGPRLFRVDRVSGAETLDEIFEPPDSFDMKAFVYRSIAFAADTWQVELWLDLPPDRVTYRFPPAFAEYRPEGRGTVMKCTVSYLEDLALLLLEAECSIEIRRPDELNDAFRTVAQRALQIADQSS
jgi:predicted DNA-binding transcriptional regulator YafY